MEGINVPRSNRIVGKPEKDCRIYIEDYVKSYIARLSQDASDKGNIEILYGKYRTDGNHMEIDVNGAAALANISQTGNQEGRLGREIEVLNVDFFPELEPVGWFYNPVRGSAPDYSEMMNIHEELLGERTGILILPNPDSPDPDVYSYAQDGFRKHKGYIIYYEKNPEMQEYLLAHTRKKGKLSGAKEESADAGRQDKLSSGALFKQRIISLPAKVKSMGMLTAGKEGAEKQENNTDGEPKRGFYVPLSVSFLITGLLVIVLTGMLISFKTYYYTNFDDTIEYVKEFIRYCFRDGG